jgi:hypothetical protein
MIVETVAAAVVAEGGRLDASYYLSPGVLASTRIHQAVRKGTPVRPLGGDDGLAEVTAPKRFRRVYAVEGEDSVPYLRPYDIFDYLPVPADHLSRRYTDVEGLSVDDSMILLTCSGRNLGPAVAVDQYLARFVMSHDVLRIKVEDSALRPFVLTLLNSPTGQELVRRDMSGSVIDHITVGDAQRLLVPLVDEGLREAVSALTSTAIRLRERARVMLDRLIRDMTEALPPLPRIRAADGWVMRAPLLANRLDAAPFHPGRLAAAGLLRADGGVTLNEVAEIRKPASRYKAYHVESNFGRPFLAGGQLRQATVIAPKFMAERVFSDPDRYRLHVGEVVFAADGRADEGLGLPVMVTSDRDGWLASEHVMRLVARPGVDAGWLYVAFATGHVQKQVQGLARGSVVDTLYEDDLGRVVLPAIMPRVGNVARTAWRDFSLAETLSARAVALLESAFSPRPGAAADVLLTEEEAVAVTGLSRRRLREDRTRGGDIWIPMPDGSVLIRLDHALDIVSRGSTLRPALAETTRILHGRIIEVLKRSVVAVVSVEPDGPGEELELPRYVFVDKDADRVREGDRFLWRTRRNEVAGGRARDDSALRESIARLVPRPVLTSQEVDAAGRWADEIARSLGWMWSDRAARG